MAAHIKISIILYKYLIMNDITSNAFESQSNTGFTFAIRAVYIWHLKQSAIDRHN